MVVNNILSGSPQPQMRMSHRNLPPKSYTVESNLIHGESEAIGRNNIRAVPQFVDADAKDFRLRPGSPGVDQDRSHPQMGEVDHAGQPHSAGRRVDIGAYELPVP